MRKVIYSMNVSLDGFIAGPAGEIDWSEPDEELHRFHNRELEEAGVHLCGRRLYEVMAYWDDPEQYSSGSEHELEFARIWQDTPKIVFSTTLDRVGPNATLAKDAPARRSRGCASSREATSPSAVRAWPPRS